MNRQHLSSLAWLVEATGATAFDLVIVIIFSNGSTFSILVLVIASCGIVMANVTGALTLGVVVPSTAFHLFLACNIRG
ncbi:hypothetical protein BHM03_00051460 [Ensete ventricosum]|nr:hypothetical protein BHM03_00051460 [Ensete ventricosum]